MSTIEKTVDGWLTCTSPDGNVAIGFISDADGIEALRALPTIWRDTTPVAGECGKFYMVVRETFDGRFFFAGLTVERRHVELPLNFLPEGEWRMETFSDDLALTPKDYKAIRIDSCRVSHGQTISFDMVDEGGAVAIFRKI